MKNKRKYWYYSQKDSILADNKLDKSYKFVGSFSLEVAEEYAKKNDLTLTYRTSHYPVAV